MKLIVGLLAVTLLTPPSASAEEMSDNDRFRLWNACKPIDLVVEQLAEDADLIGLDQEEVESAVRSRMRNGGIYDETQEPFLYVNVNIVGPAFHMSVEFVRRVSVVMPAWEKSDGRVPSDGLAIMWVEAFTGVHAQQAAYIMSHVSRMVDTFVDEYLWVNAGAC